MVGERDWAILGKDSISVFRANADFSSPALLSNGDLQSVSYCFLAAQCMVGLIHDLVDDRINFAYITNLLCMGKGGASQKCGYLCVTSGGVPGVGAMISQLSSERF